MIVTVLLALLLIFAPVLFALGLLVLAGFGFALCWALRVLVVTWCGITVIILGDKSPRWAQEISVG